MQRNLVLKRIFTLLFFCLIALMLVILLLPRHQQIASQIVIQQPIERVWQHFQCVPNYSKWNKLFRIAKYPASSDQFLDVEFLGDEQQVVMHMQARLLKNDFAQLSWEGKVIRDGIFNGRHQFQFQALDAHSTLMTQTEDFQGIWVPLLNYFVIRPTQNNFDQMNQSFKSYVEQYPVHAAICS